LLIVHLLVFPAFFDHYPPAFFGRAIPAMFFSARPFTVGSVVAAFFIAASVPVADMAAWFFMPVAEPAATAKPAARAAVATAVSIDSGGFRPIIPSKPAVPIFPKAVPPAKTARGAAGVAAGSTAVATASGVFRPAVPFKTAAAVAITVAAASGVFRPVMPFTSTPFSPIFPVIPVSAAVVGAAVICPAGPCRAPFFAHFFFKHAQRFIKAFEKFLGVVSKKYYRLPVKSPLISVFTFNNVKVKIAHAVFLDIEKIRPVLQHHLC
jgi:hypothetical protein